MLKTIQQRNLHAVILLLLAQLMVSMNVVGSKLISSHIGIVSAVFFRFLVAFIVSLFIALAATPRNTLLTEIQAVTFKEWLLLSIQGLCAGILFNAFMFWGLHYASASIAGMVLSLLPAFIALSAVVFLNERLTLARLLCIGFAVMGLLIIHHGPSTDGSNGLGLLLLLLALIPESGYYLLLKVRQPTLSVYVKTVVMNGINVLLLLPIVLWQGKQTVLGLDLITSELLVMTGFAATGFFIFCYLGAKQMSASKVGVFTAISPVMTVLISMMVIGESLTLTQWVGMTVIVFSILINAL